MLAAPLKLNPATPRRFRDLAEGVIQVHLDDVNSMLRIPALGPGGCAYPITQTLLAVVGGLSTVVYASTRRNSGERFTRLLEEHYPWSAEPEESVPKGVGPSTLYEWFRNPEEHALSLETYETDGGLLRMSKGSSRMGLRRQLPGGVEDWSDDTLSELEGDERPTSLSATLSEHDQRVWLTVEALYWGVRRLVESVTRSPERMEVAGWFLGEHDRVPRLAEQ
jgi:hypothetical protein